MPAWTIKSFGKVDGVEWEEISRERRGGEKVGEEGAETMASGKADRRTGEG